MQLKELLSLNNVALIGVATYLLSTIRGWLMSLFIFVKRRFIMGVSVSGPYMESKVKEWLVNNCYSESSRKLISNNNMYLYNEFNKSLMWGNYLIRVDKFCWAYVYSFQIRDALGGSDGIKNMLGVDFYGFGREKKIEEIKATFEYKEKEDDLLRLAALAPSVFGAYTTKEPKSHKKIFGSFVNEVENSVDKFLNNKHIYDKFGRKYKNIILLYGPPGTGKTSIIKYLAEKLDIKCINYIDGLLTSNESASVVATAINDRTMDHTNKKGERIPALCIIEDIDKSVFGVGDVKNESEEERRRIFNNMLKEKGHTIDKLMQLFDSSISPNNFILIITTNNIDLLPEPLLRSGRVDSKIYVGPLNRKDAIDMCKYYDIDPDEILDNDKEEFNPADLENMLFNKLMEDKNESKRS